MTTAKSESKAQSREEKIEEILAILGELYQRLGSNPQAAASAASPDYKFVGYRPYPTQEVQSWARGQAGTPTPGMAIPSAEHLTF